MLADGFFLTVSPGAAVLRVADEFSLTVLPGAAARGAAVVASATLAGLRQWETPFRGQEGTRLLCTENGVLPLLWTETQPPLFYRGWQQSTVDGLPPA